MSGGYGYRNPCVVCGAGPFQRCVVPRTGRKTDTHMARVRGQWPDGSPAKITLAPVPEVCICGNRFDGDNLCMISACQEET